MLPSRRSQSSRKKQDAMNTIRSSNQAQSGVELQTACDMSPPTSVFRRHARNPLSQAVFDWLCAVGDESRVTAQNELHDVVGSLAEHDDVQAATATLFLALEDGTLRAVVTYNVHKMFRDLHRDAAGIVPLVARRRTAYVTGDTQTDPYYFEDVAETRSEIAIPLVLQNGDLLGVLNFESPRQNAFGDQSLATINGQVEDMFVHLLVLRGLEDNSVSWCPWHPLVHGWDFQPLVASMCREIADCLDRDVTKCMVWYADRTKDELFVYATFGYDYKYRNRATLELSNSRVGDVVRAPAGAVVALDPSKFIKHKKALIMRIGEGYGSPIYPAEEATDSLGVAALTIYFNSTDDEECKAGRGEVAKEALAEICRMLGCLTQSFRRQRKRIMIETVGQLLKLPEDVVGSHFDRLVDVARTDFESPAVSIWGHPMGSRRLECLGTTGLKDLRDKVIREQHAGDGCFYDLDEDQGSYTVFVTTMQGKALRKNKIGNTQEKGLPAGCPETPKAKFVEHLVGGNYQRRRLLCVAVMDGEELLGVIRIVRPEVSKPFTVCDEGLIEVLADCARPALLAWRRSRAAAGSSNEEQILRVEVRSSAMDQT
jgi:hypothetical protein